MRLPNHLVLAAGCHLAALLSTGSASAHCDALDGPVVTAARDALQAGDVRLVLVWVQKMDEPEIKDAFERTLAVRKLGAQAMDLADRFFFETLVRVHRGGEGAPYTGLKPAGSEITPAILAVDKALQTGNHDSLAKQLAEATQTNLRDLYKRALSLKSYRRDDVEAGRKYVKAYVTFIHYAERLVQAAGARVALEHDAQGGEPHHAHER